MHLTNNSSTLALNLFSHLLSGQGSQVLCESLSKFWGYRAGHSVSWQQQLHRCLKYIGWLRPNALLLWCTDALIPWCSDARRLPFHRPIVCFGNESELAKHWEKWKVAMKWIKFDTRKHWSYLWIPNLCLLQLAPLTTNQSIIRPFRTTRRPPDRIQSNCQPTAPHTGQSIDKCFSVCLCVCPAQIEYFDQVFTPPHAPQRLHQCLYVVGSIWSQRTFGRLAEG